MVGGGEVLNPTAQSDSRRSVHVTHFRQIVGRSTRLGALREDRSGASLDLFKERRGGNARVPTLCDPHVVVSSLSWPGSADSTRKEFSRQRSKREQHPQLHSPLR